MHMIRRAADGQRLYVVLTRDAAEVSPKPFSDGGGEE
jgi:hypothetical protein